MKLPAWLIREVERENARRREAHRPALQIEEYIPPHVPVPHPIVIVWDEESRKGAF